MPDPIRPERLAEIREADGQFPLLPSAASVYGHRRELLAEVTRLAASVGDYENRITWHTTCQQCATVLDRAIADYERAERAEGELAKAHAEIQRLTNPSPEQVREMQAAMERDEAAYWEAAARRELRQRTGRQHTAGPTRQGHDDPQSAAAPDPDDGSGR